MKKTKIVKWKSRTAPHGKAARRAIAHLYWRKAKAGIKW